MKKFTKTCFITAGILLACGLTICTVCALIAGPQLLDFKSDFWSNMPGNIHFSSGSSFITHDGFDDQNQIFDKEYSNDQVALAGEIKNLNFDINRGTVILQESDDKYYHISYKGDGHLQYDIKDKTLYIVGFYKSDERKEFTKDKLILAIPKKQVFDNIYVSCDAGSFESDLLESDSIKLDLNAASISMDELTAKTAVTTANAASLAFHHTSVSDFTLDMNAGAIDYNGEINSNGEITLHAGSGEFVLNGTPKDFNYNLDCAMGEITIAGKSYSGVALVNGLDNNADADLSISCAMGSVDFSFQ